MTIFGGKEVSWELKKMRALKSYITLEIFLQYRHFLKKYRNVFNVDTFIFYFLKPWSAGL